MREYHLKEVTFSKLIFGALALAAAATTVVGLVNGAWYASFGLVMFMAFMICLVSAFLGINAPVMTSENKRDADPAGTIIPEEIIRRKSA